MISIRDNDVRFGCKRSLERAPQWAADGRGHTHHLANTVHSRIIVLIGLFIQMAEPYMTQ